jgi:hypothetical protein
MRGRWSEFVYWLGQRPPLKRKSDAIYTTMGDLSPQNSPKSEIYRKITGMAHSRGQCDISRQGDDDN